MAAHARERASYVATILVDRLWWQPEVNTSLSTDSNDVDNEEDEEEEEYT